MHSYEEKSNCKASNCKAKLGYGCGLSEVMMSFGLTGQRIEKGVLDGIT